MLKSSFRLLSFYTKRTPFITPFKNYGSITNINAAFFCKTEKHQSNIHGHKHDHHHRHHNQQKHQQNEPHPEENTQTHQKQENSQHEHRQHQHKESQAQQNHQHKYGGGKHGHDHHAAHQAKLSKMTFEQLVQIRTEESMKLAHHKYQHQVRRLKEMKEEKEHLHKNIKFFQKIQNQIKEKEVKLVQNIKLYEEEVELSKKRAQKQIQESKNYAVTKIAKELLQVADCIANCKKYADQTEDKDTYIEQVVKSQVLIKDILKKYDIEEFDPTNQEYDPNSQQSLLQVPTPPGYKPNHVAMTMRTGYTIKGRLLRSARVGIFS